MLKITPSAEDDITVTLKLEGRIVGPWVEELRKECEKRQAEGKKIVLDLLGVGFVNEEGIRALNALTSEQVELVGSSLFVSGLLNGGGIDRGEGHANSGRK